MSIPTFSTPVQHAGLARSVWLADDRARGWRWRIGLIRNFNTHSSFAYPHALRAERKQRIKASP